MEERAPGRRPLSWSERPAEPVLPLGTTRMFRVMRLPGDAHAAAASGRGPILSAYDYDQEVLWRRAAQAWAACRSDLETFNVVPDGANSHGLLAQLLGLRAFLPYSQLPREAGQYWGQQVRGGVRRGQALAALAVTPLCVMSASCRVR